MPLLLVNPGVSVSTAQVFRRWGGEDGGPLPSNFHHARNDLEAPAREVAPAVAEVLELLRSCAGTTMARMSGSGATCFALFEDDAARDAAAAVVRAARLGWWQLVTRLA
jgi:4-diphosphocytidyl-2-C-methyl-D-erythritol kinase